MTEVVPENGCVGNGAENASISVAEEALLTKTTFGLAFKHRDILEVRMEILKQKHYNTIAVPHAALHKGAGATAQAAQ